MNVPAPAGAAVAPRSLREEAEGQLWLALGLLAALTVFTLLGRVLLEPAQPAPGEELPQGTGVSHTPLPLDALEAARFDSALLGSAGQAASAQGELRLQARIPDLNGRPFRPAPGSELDVPQVRQAFAALRSCSEAGACERAVILQALAVVSDPGPVSEGGGPCNTEPRTASEVQVPVALHAIVLSLLPECRAQALQRFAVLDDKLTFNINAGNLKALPGAAGLLYARLAQAKLADAVGGNGRAAFPGAIRAIRSEILATPELHDAWEQLAELPQWGLSMAEIQAEWLWAEAREQAHRGTAGLPARLAALLDSKLPQQLAGIGTPSQGQARLRFAWCALGLRAELPAALSSFCLVSLAHAPALSPLRCALLARGALVSGQWDADSICGGDPDSAQAQPAAAVLERFAADHRVWRELLGRYQQGTGLDSEQRTRLEGYLTAYARVSGNSERWLWLWHPLACVGLVAASVVLAIGWLAWLWAYLVRWRSLQRFLPAPLALDP